MESSVFSLQSQLHANLHTLSMSSTRHAHNDMVELCDTQYSNSVMSSDMQCCCCLLLANAQIVARTLSHGPVACVRQWLCVCVCVRARVCVIVHFVTSLIAYMRLCRTPHCHPHWPFCELNRRRKNTFAPNTLHTAYRVHVHHHTSQAPRTAYNTYPRIHDDDDKYVRVLLICQNKPAMLLLFSIF